MEMGLKETYGLFLLYSYAYYKRNVSLVTDANFDLMCEKLRDNFDKFDHRYKHLITIDDLNAGTGYAVQYPPELRRYYEREIDARLKERGL